MNTQPRAFDIIVSNPPYISSVDFELLEPEVNRFEPRLALTDESNGLSFYRRISQLAPKLLPERGRLLVEIGFGAKEWVEKILQKSGQEVLRTVSDLAGIPRVIVAALEPSKCEKMPHSVQF